MRRAIWTKKLAYICDTVKIIIRACALLNFIAIAFFLNKDVLKKVVIHFTSKDKSPSSNSNDANNNEIPMREFDLIIDDTMRQNAIICDV